LETLGKHAGIEGRKTNCPSSSQPVIVKLDDKHWTNTGLNSESVYDPGPNTLNIALWDRNRCSLTVDEMRINTFLDSYV